METCKHVQDYEMGKPVNVNPTKWVGEGNKVYNVFVTVGVETMSESLGNYATLHFEGL